MIRNIFLFLGTFVAGALIALVVRAAKFNPHAGHETHAAGGGDYLPMVNNPIAPAVASPGPPPAPEVERKAGDPHASHGSKAVATATDEDKPVNTVCAICGMEVDPSLPTLEYMGRKIGFGCKMCPAKFKSDPDRYGPYYLRNEVIKK
ncbi:MAG: hypothetical protein KBA71_04110 [Opitutaceae bacterium]|nr:hypothetical protein [Opitutaceae bacterium]